MFVKTITSIKNKKKLIKKKHMITQQTFYGLCMFSPYSIRPKRHGKNKKTYNADVYI